MKGKVPTPPPTSLEVQEPPPGLLQVLGSVLAGALLTVGLLLVLIGVVNAIV